MFAGDQVLWTRAAPDAQVRGSRPGTVASTLFERKLERHSDDETGEFASGGVTGFSASPSFALLSGCGAPVVKDLATGEVKRTLSGVGSNPRIAGRYLASAYQGKLVVLDWDAGVVAYEIPLAGEYAYDLEPDGSVATVQFAGKPACGNGALRFHSAASPGGVESAVEPCEAVLAADGGKAAVIVAAPGGAKVVAAVGADGARTDMAWLGTGARRTAGLDFRAREVAYALLDCDGIAVVLRSAAPMERSVPTECLRLRIRRVRISGGRLVVSGVAAKAFTGRIELEYSLRVGRRTRVLARTVKVRDGAFAYSAKLPSSWLASKRAARVGDVDVTFGGDPTWEDDADTIEVATPLRR